MTRWLFIVALLLGCNSPTAPHDSSCAESVGCTPGLTAIVRPSAEDESAAIQRARDEVSADMRAARIGESCITPAPSIEYVGCPFRVRNSNFGDVCAAGMTDTKHHKVVISTFERDRTVALVYWEARNYFWCMNGLCHKAS